VNAERLAVDVAVQAATTDADLPDEATVTAWIERTLGHIRHTGPASVAVRIVDAEESRTYNRDYRGKDRPTNVLSFPAELPQGLPTEAADELGDLVICAPVVVEEAESQGKLASYHWAHLLVHGTLHLAGYDHENDADAEVMEALERDILAAHGVPDPYGAGG